MTILVRKCSFSEIEGASNFASLLAEYGDESCIDGMPSPSANLQAYRHLESIGMLHIIGAFLEDLLVGFISIMPPVLPHYSARTAVSESFFVGKEYRKTGAGLKLLYAAEAYAQEIGAPGLLISAPFGGDLAEVLPHVGYVETNRVFFKKAK